MASDLVRRLITALTVHVTGAVLQPGVYALADGLRIGDAIERAGGPSDGADVSRLNLALRLQDGQQVIVPRLGEPARPAVAPTARAVSQRTPRAVAATTPRAVAATTPRAVAATTPGHKLNLNQASAVDLEALPGIGRVTAERIVNHREQHGPFASVDDVRRARLVPASTLDRIKELIELP